MLGCTSQSRLVVGSHSWHATLSINLEELAYSNLSLFSGATHARVAQWVREFKPIHVRNFVRTQSHNANAPVIVWWEVVSSTACNKNKKKI